MWRLWYCNLLICIQVAVSTVDGYVSFDLAGLCYHSGWLISNKLKFDHDIRMFWSDKCPISNCYDPHCMLVCRLCSCIYHNNYCCVSLIIAVKLTVTNNQKCTGYSMTCSCLQMFLLAWLPAFRVYACLCEIFVLKQFVTGCVCIGVRDGCFWTTRSS